MSTVDFRAQSRAVRAEAQQTLKRLRSQRRATSRRGAVAADPSPAPSPVMDEAVQPPQTAAPDAITVSSSAAALMAGVEAADETPTAAPIEAIASPDDDVEMAPDLAVADAPLDEAADSAPIEDVADAADDFDAEPVGEPEDAPVASDLSELPGVGPGLVWVLGEAGVRSLADFASADAAALRESLGPIGKLLDLDGLKSEAEKRLG